MNRNLKKQFVKVPTRQINNIANKTIQVDAGKAMNKLMANPKLVKTLQKLAVV